MKRSANNLLWISFFFLAASVVCLFVKGLHTFAFGAFALCIGCFLMFGFLTSINDEIERLEWLYNEDELKIQELERRIRELEKTKKE